MSTELLPVWHEIEMYHKAGISIIPVRDHDDAYGVAKSPFGGSWKLYQFEIIALDTLFDLMDVKFNTKAVGIVGGKVSGNLEIIDIDVKYFPGIDAVLFTDLKTLYPDIFARLRIHKTPSGGYHILYRCAEVIEGNQKLAGRHATADELLANPKTKTYNFLETRGEGGYVVAPPAMGYAVVKAEPFNVISKAERDSIIALCRSYNEIIKIDAPYKPTKQENQYYDTNPFEDFNYRVDPTELIEGLGWSQCKAANKFIWYTRPGKSQGVSMSFNLEKRFFYCFTASTELEANKGYTPANLLALLQFGNDKKKLYAYLVANGYGKIKPKIEQRLAKTAAINGKPLPANISNDGATLRSAITATLDQQHPYGVFWIDSFEHGIQIDRELLYRVADGLGFKLFNKNLIKSDGTYIEEVEPRFFFDEIKKYIREEDADLYKDICNAYETFIEKHGAFTISRLQILPDNLILKDTKDTAFKCYQNGILKITAAELEVKPYTSFNGKLIWKKNVQPRNFIPGNSGRYLEFLQLATEYNINSSYILNCIGYLAHEYKDGTVAYIIVLTEQCENPKDGGGAGKNVFSELFKKITTFVSKPGSQIKYDEKFMQSWNGQRIFCLSDVSKNFNYGFLKELASGSGLMKKLFKDEAEITADLMPKFLIQTNYSPKITDGGLKRRIRIIEFTNFFTKCGGVDKHFSGCYFPDEWNQDDWSGFDSLMAEAVQHWLANGRSIPEAALSYTGWTKQFRNEYGELLAGFIEEHISEWVQTKFISNDDFQLQKNKYLRDNEAAFFHGKDKSEASAIFINNAIRTYCKKNEIDFEGNCQKKVNAFKEKGKWFCKESALPFL